MFEYMTAQEAAEKWNVSLRWVQRLCKGNRIEGVMNINRVWLIPKNDIKVKREVLKLAQLMLGLFCCSKTISYQ